MSTDDPIAIPVDNLLPVLSAGTTHREIEYYDVAGRYDESRSVSDTLKNYLNEVKLIPIGNMDRMKVIHVLYEYLLQHKKFCRKQIQLFTTTIKKAYEFKEEKISDHDRGLLDEYRHLLAPRPSFLRDVKTIPTGYTYALATMGSEINARALFCYLYSEYLCLNWYDMQWWSSGVTSVIAIVLYYDGKVVGYGRLVSHTSNWLASLHIQREHRRNGSGRTIIDLLRERVPNFSVESLDDAIDFYRKCGGQQDADKKYLFRFGTG